VAALYPKTIVCQTKLSSEALGCGQASPLYRAHMACQPPLGDPPVRDLPLASQRADVLPSNMVRSSRYQGAAAMDEGGELKLASLATEFGPLEKEWECSFAEFREQAKEDYSVEQDYRLAFASSLVKYTDGLFRGGPNQSFIFSRAFPRTSASMYMATDATAVANTPKSSV
jgi:hypothetical protein